MGFVRAASYSPPLSRDPGIPVDGAPLHLTAGLVVGNPGVIGAVRKADDLGAAAVEEILRARLADRPAAVAIFQLHDGLAGGVEVLEILFRDLASFSHRDVEAPDLCPRRSDEFF